MTSNGAAAAVVATPLAASRIAPRGPMLLRDLGQLVADERSSWLGLSKISVSSAMVTCSLSRSDSSSRVLNFVRRRSGMSRM